MATPLAVARDAAARSAASNQPMRQPVGWEVWVALGSVLVAGVFALREPDASARALGELPRAERAALYERTRANAATLCAGEPALRDRCGEELRLLVQLPECDGACRAFAAAARPGPTR